MASAGSGLLALLDTLTFPELLAIIVIALVVLGPEKLPGAARTAGVWVQKLRSLSATLESEVREVLDDPSMQPIRELGEFAAQPRRKLAEYARSAGADDAPSTPSTPAATPVVTTSPIPAVEAPADPVPDAEVALEADLAPQPGPVDEAPVEDAAGAPGDDAAAAPVDDAEAGTDDETEVAPTKIVAVGPDHPMEQLSPSPDEPSDPGPIAQ